jgi:hypothetical protein
MQTADAVRLLEILENAERYVCKYRKDDQSTHHVWPSDTLFEAKMMSADLYRMAKLAGKPED